MLARELIVRALVAIGMAASALVAIGSVAVAASQGAVDRTPTPPITFTKHIAPIVFDRCAGCHRPDGPAPFSLLTYSAARVQATQIAAVTKRRLMPPWKSEPGYGEFIGHRPLSSAEIDLMQRWVDEGAIEGDARDLPRPPQWTLGWQLGTPDLIVSPAEPYALRAEGADAFHVFVIPIPTNIGRYVRGIEFRPHNRQVVHHANILLDRTPTSRIRNEEDPHLGDAGFLSVTAESPAGHFLGWTPGPPEPLLPQGLSWRLEPGTDLVVQLHMKPSGKSELVQFSIGFFFSPDPPERVPAVLRLGRQQLEIPPGEKAYSLTDAYVLPVDVEVLALKPHAHYRARQVTSFATLPDGTRTWLLLIKDWDFNWQHVYRRVTPVVLPKGTTVTMQITYDNSAENPRNPQQPPRRVRWGPLASDEMGDLWIQVLTRDAEDLAILNHDFRRKRVSADIVGMEALIETDSTNVALHNDVAVLYLELGQTKEAIDRFEAAVRLKPDSADGYFNLGTALMRAGRLDEAIDRYRDALRIRPDSAAAHNNLGNALDEQGRLDEALAHYRETLRLQPEHAGAHNNVGFILARRGIADEALHHFREALRINPQLPDAHYNLAVALESRGQSVEALHYFREALRYRPDWVPVLMRLAWVSATATDDQLRDGRQAVRLGERAADLTGRRDAKALDVLAAAYAEVGEFGLAVDVIQEALRLSVPVAVERSMLQREQLFRKRLPYREAVGVR